jgi:hypothetical protein
MSSPSSFDTRSEPPIVEPILIAAVVFVLAVLAVVTLFLAAS